MNNETLIKYTQWLYEECLGLDDDFKSLSIEDASSIIDEFKSLTIKEE